MRIATTHTTVIGAFALVLATAALLAPGAAGKPIPRQFDQPNVLGSQLDRLPPAAVAPAVVQRDVFERAAYRRQVEIAARSARGARHQPPIAQATVDGGSGTFNWGVLALASAAFAVCLALGGATLASTRGRGRVSTS